MFGSRRGTFPSTSLARVLNARKRIQREQESKRRLIERETHDKDSSATNDEFFESNQHRPEGRGFSLKKERKTRLESGDAIVWNWKSLPICNRTELKITAHIIDCQQRYSTFPLARIGGPHCFRNSVWRAAGESKQATMVDQDRGAFPRIKTIRLRRNERSAARSAMKRSMRIYPSIAVKKRNLRRAIFFITRQSTRRLWTRNHRYPLCALHHRFAGALSQRSQRWFLSFPNFTMSLLFRNLGAR